MTLSPFDTVAAVSTPYGKGGVAVIRLSGDEAVSITERIFFPMSGRALSSLPPRTAVYGLVRDPDTNEILDDALATVFPSPRSFTGEDTVEISCHGGVLVTRHVLEACLRAGARAATAGEFTRRAFMNGKLDLERAEALGNLLDAGNDEQLRLSRAGMNGLLTARADETYASLCGVLANLEAGMDFPEEDLTDLSREELLAAVRAARAAIADLLRTYRTGHAIAEGVPTVICGRPNVGKSAFYNRLVGREAAIVTDIAGTTRDVLTDTVSLGRVTLRLSDTAGLRPSDDPVERIGVAKAHEALEAAELVLLLSDADQDPAADALYKDLTGKGKTVLRIRTKCDLPADGPLPPKTAIRVSSLTGEGFDALSDSVETAFIDADLRVGDEAVVFSARQAAALRAAADALDTSAASLFADLPYDICADDIRAAQSELAALCGREATEDIITEIFSRFCVGK